MLTHACKQFSSQQAKFSFYMSQSSVDNLKGLCTQIRRDILRMVHNVQSGHPGGSMGCTELFVALYAEVMNHGDNVQSENQDHFFLSNGHISPVFYSTLARSGYFPVEELSTFRKIDSRLQGHPTTHEGLPGVNIASGSLGQGLSVAIGTALAKSLNGYNGRVFCLMGDGELQEGQIWEAAMYAPAKGVKNLIGIVDVNGQQIDGTTNDVLPLLSLKAKFESFGWTVLELNNGNNIQQVISSLNAGAELANQGPVMILMTTAMGSGVDFMENDHKWHGVAPNDEQLEQALSQLEETVGDYNL